MNQATDISSAETVEAPGMEVVLQPPTPVRVGWIAGSETNLRLGRTLQPLAVGLIDELVKVTAFSPEGRPIDDLPCPPMEQIPYRPKRWYQRRPQSLQEMAARIHDDELQLLHALDSTVGSLTRRLAIETHLPYVVSAFEVGGAGHLSRIDSQASAVQVTSEPIQRDLLEHKVVRAEKMHLVRPGVYTVRHPTCFSEPGNRPAIVTGGRLDSAEILEPVLRNFAALAGRGHECVFFVIGNGRAEKSLRKRVEDLGLSHDLTFVDGMSAVQLSGILKAADLYVVPSASPIVDVQALIAMSVGVPVVMAGAGASDFLVDGQTAVSFDRETGGDLADRLVELIENHALARQLGAKALDYVRQKHSPAVMVSLMAELYRKVVADTTHIEPEPVAQVDAV
jgi:glycosyltransferase involved in cell wall biosynthesis